MKNPQTKIIPSKSYGILTQDNPLTLLDDIAEDIRRLGYAILDSGYTNNEINNISNSFNIIRNRYINRYGEEYLKKIDEYNTIRAPLEFGDPVFINLATNINLITLLAMLLKGKFILNQQNGIINPSKVIYNQGLWHRDLPYQHFISNTPLAINALFCVDDFTEENGSTFVLPSSHRSANFPSDSYIKRNCLQIEAKAGQFIILDCMLFHCGGFNQSEHDRRAVNHVYTIPYFKQQIKLPAILNTINLSENQKDLFGFTYEEPNSVDNYLNRRKKL